MPIILVIGLLLVATATWLAVRAFGKPRAAPAKTLGHMEAYGFSQSGPAGGAAVAERAPRRVHLHLRRRIDTFATVIGKRLVGRVPGAKEEQLRKLLMAAGHYRAVPAKFVGYQAIAAVVLPALWLWVTAKGSVAPPMVVLGTIVCIVFGWVVPLTILKRRAQARTDEIDYEMPQLIDTLVTTVEAGISLAASLQIAAQRFHGPLAEELRLVIQEQSMGLGLKESLAHMLERCDTPATRSFVRSITQGELLGVSIAQTFRNLATEMRSHHRQAAEERAQKAPLKMLFPLVFLIFPAVFLVLLGPAAIRIVTTVGG